MCRKQNNETMQYLHDCGAWDHSRGNTVKLYYLLNPDMSLQLINNVKVVHCKGKNKNKTVWFPMDPQPDHSKVVLFYRYRYYNTLVAKSDYKRRVSWFDFPTTFTKKKNVAVIEYSGQFPSATIPHSNS